MKARKTRTLENCCTFCRELISPKRRGVAGPDVFICADCVGTCVDLITDEDFGSTPHAEEIRRRDLLAKQRSSDPKILEVSSISKGIFRYREMTLELDGAPGVYTVFTSVDCYVGKTTNLKRRLSEHMASKKRSWETAFYIIVAEDGLLPKMETWALRQVLLAGLPVSNNAPTARLPGGWTPPPPCTLYWPSRQTQQWIRQTQTIAANELSHAA